MLIGGKMFKCFDFMNAIKKEMEERKDNHMIRLDICNINYLYNELILSCNAFFKEIESNCTQDENAIELNKKSKSELIHMAVCIMWLWLR